MMYSAEVKEMCTLAKGPNHGASKLASSPTFS